MKIAFIIPIKNRKNNISETYFNKIMLPSLIKTVDTEKYNISIYLGYDKDDILYSEDQQKFLINNFKNFTFKFIEFDKNVKKGHLTKMWNILFQEAYNDDNIYMYQCGDDLHFLTNNWLNDSVEILNNNNNIGISGPMNDNMLILTQSLIHRNHMKIFGYFLDSKNIINYYLDDWLNLIYSPKNVFIMKNHYCPNEPKEPRYQINFDLDKLKSSVKYHKSILDNYQKT